MLADLRYLLRGCTWIVVFLVVSSVLSGIFMFVQPFLVGQLVGTYSSVGELDTTTLIVFIAIFAVTSLLSVVVNYSSQILAQRFTLNCQLSAGRKIFGLNLEELSGYLNGELSSRVISDISMARQLVSSQALSIPSSILLVLGVTISVIIIDPVLSLTMLCALLLLLVVAMISSKWISKMTKEIQKHYSEIGQGIQRFVSNAIFVKANNLEEQCLTDYQKSASLLLKSSRKFARISATLSPLSNFLSQILIVAIVILGGVRVSSGALSYESLATILTFLFIIISPISNLVQGISNVAAGKAALDRLNPLLLCYSSDILPSQMSNNNHDNSRAKILDDTLHSTLHFDNVSVKYNENSPSVLSNMSFDCPSKGIVAITGTSGVGKTTIALTAIGILRPSEGTVSYGEMSIEDLGYSFVREKLVSLVLQNSPLYGRTVRDALTLGKDISDEILLEWIIKFGLEKFYNALPNGLDSNLSDVTSEASAGEIQRLSIIRGFLRNTPIIILDEPTSNLDVETEKLVSKIIHKLSKDRTIIVISHRSAPISGAIKHIQL